MGYIEDSLTPGERVLYRAQIHWVVYGRAIVFALLGLSLFVALAAFGVSIDSPAYWLAGLLLAAAAGVFIVALIHVRSTDLAVTNYRVLAKHGLFRREAIEQNLKTLDGVAINQTVLGRILGYGSVETRGSGGGHTPINNISRPLEFRREVEMAANAFRAHPTN